MFGYLSLNTICFDEQFFRERTPRKTVSFEDIFEHISFLVYAKWGLLCLFCFNYFSQRAQYHSNIPHFNWGMFSHLKRLEQSRASENINHVTPL